MKKQASHVLCKTCLNRCVTNAPPVMQCTWKIFLRGNYVELRHKGLGLFPGSVSGFLCSSKPPQAEQTRGVASVESTPNSMLQLVHLHLSLLTRTILLLPSQITSLHCGQKTAMFLLGCLPPKTKLHLMQ